MPEPILDVLHARPLVGVRLQRFSEKVDGIGEDGQLAHFGAAEGPVHSQEIAQVQCLGQRPTGLAHLLLAHEHLNSSGPIADVQEVDLALEAALDDAAGNSNFRWRRLLRRQRPNLADRPMAVKTSAPRIQTELFNPAQLVDSAGLE